MICSHPARAVAHSLLAGCCGAAALLAPVPLRAGMLEQIVISHCSQAMKAEFDKAAKTPPTGMVDFTCTCVADAMLTRRQSLDQAKTRCTALATRKYGAI